MSNLINTYPVFESSQVLTSSQLNQIVSYLDQQSRLTRARLIGMGIVCGFELSYDDSGSNPQITISKGTAITSEGFLITLGKCETSWYRPYVLPEGVDYNPFGDPDQDVTLYELLKEPPEDTSDVKPFDTPANFLDDKFLLLFLEIFDNDQKPCLVNTCDELGIGRIFTVRKLLISKDDLDLVLTRSGNVGNLYPDKFELPDIVMPRPLFNPDDDHSKVYEIFSKHYADTLTNTYAALFGNGTDGGVLSRTYSIYELLLEPVYNFTDPFEVSAIGDLKTTWSDFIAETSDYRGIQYFYDFLKDLILAYNEFRKTAFELMSQCCPDMSLFPKHVMLGRAIVPNETAEEAKTYRHGFTQPPIYNHQKYLIEKTISLHKRLVLMVEKFNLERVNSPDIEGEGAPPLRITPSDEKNTALSERSIPYYYDSKDVSEILEKGTLEHYWHYDITRKKLPDTTAFTLSYENQSEDQSPIGSPLETPLYYDLDSYPFLRIEGHIGRDYEEMVDLINTMKSNFDLPFDTVALQLDPDSELLELDYSCGFEDLQEEYTIARTTYCGFIRNLIRLFKFIMENEDSIFNGDAEDTSEDLETIGEILNMLQQLCKIMTDCLDEFDFAEFQKNYKTTLQFILDFILVKKELLNEVSLESEDTEEQIKVVNGIIQRLSPALFRIVDLLFYNTFLRVYYAFKRREYYLQRETSVFSAYIRRHPGVAHQAGVPKGGTFILVYDSNEDQAVFADFNLPYLCCSADRCVPMCEEEGSDFVFEAPPFARPDYAITTAGIPVEINVAFNDFGFWNSELQIEADSETENGGKIELLPEANTVRYIPNEEFAGFDTFEYKVINAETGATDTGTVTVLVKAPIQEEPETGCYSEEILECWSDGNIKILLTIYNRRNPNNQIPGDDLQQVLAALLESLRSTAGFTDSELKSMGPERRRALFDCISPQHPEMDNNQIRKSIETYQKINCGGPVIEDNNDEPRVELTPNDITMNELTTVLNSRNIEISSGATRADLDHTLSNTVHGMRLSRDEVSMFTKDRIEHVLKNRGADFSSSSTKKELIDTLFKQ